MSIKDEVDAAFEEFAAERRRVILAKRFSQMTAEDMALMGIPPIVARPTDEELAALQTAKPGGVTYQFRKPNRVYESMTRVQVHNFTVRVWRSEESLLSACTADNSDLIEALSAAPPHVGRLGIMAIVETVPRVVAVEVLDEHGNGPLLYPDWD